MDIPTEKYLKYCMSRVEMMLAHKVEPVLIFDGHRMVMKACTNVERSKVRRAQKARGDASHWPTRSLRHPLPCPIEMQR